MPDFANYVDLTIHDETALDVYDDSVIYAQTSLPEFNPRVGTIENAILEATSYQTASLATLVNRLPDGLMEGLLNLMGFAKNDATKAVGVATFQVTLSTGVTITAGTVVSYNVFDDAGILTQYLFETTEDLIITSGNTSGTATFTAVGAEQFPDIPVPQTLTLVSTTPYILSVSLTSLSSTGSDEETDSEYFNRAVIYLASLSAALTTASQLSAYLQTNFPTVARTAVFDLTTAKQRTITNASLTSNVVTLTTSVVHGYNTSDQVLISGMANTTYNGYFTITTTPTTTTFTYTKTASNIGATSGLSGTSVNLTSLAYTTANASGSVVIAACDAIGDPLTSAQKSIISSSVTEKCIAGLSVEVIDMQLVGVDVDIIVKTLDNYSTATVAIAVSNAIEAYLYVSGWDFATSVDSKVLASIASKIAGVKYVDDISTSISTPYSGTMLATDAGANITITKRGVIPIGSCVTTAI